MDLNTLPEHAIGGCYKMELTPIYYKICMEFSLLMTYSMKDILFKIQKQVLVQTRKG